MVGRCIPYWNSPFSGDMLNFDEFRGCTLRYDIPYYPVYTSWYIHCIFLYYVIVYHNVFHSSVMWFIVLLGLYICGDTRSFDILCSYDVVVLVWNIVCNIRLSVQQQTSNLGLPKRCRRPAGYVTFILCFTDNSKMHVFYITFICLFI